MVMRDMVTLDPITRKFSMREKCRDVTHPVSNRKRRGRLPPPALSEVNVATLGWLAGMVDADGSICIVKAKPISRGYIRYTPIIQVSGSYEPLFTFLEDNFEGLVFPKPVGKRSRKSQWTWRVANQKACNLAYYLLPYLIIKRRQAELLIEWQSTYKLSHLITDKDRLNRERIWLEIRTLNRKDGRIPNVKPVNWDM